MKELKLDDLVRIDKRGIGLDEWMTPELLGWTSAPGERTPSEGTALEAVQTVCAEPVMFSCAISGLDHVGFYHTPIAGLHAASGMHKPDVR